MNAYDHGLDEVKPCLMETKMRYILLVFPPGAFAIDLRLYFVRSPPRARTTPPGDQRGLAVAIVGLKAGPFKGKTANVAARDAAGAALVLKIEDLFAPSKTRGDAK